MNVFLSYASEDRAVAERICRVLETEQHVVFFDRDDLVAGAGYGERIRKAIERSHAFVFLVSPHSIDAGYALTELALVEARPPQRRPTIVPVLVAPTDLSRLPVILQPLTLLEPRGNLPAEVAARVATVKVVAEDERVRLRGMPSNSGWSIYIDIAERNVREIFYRLDSAPDFVSTGFNDFRNPQTGLPMPMPSIEAPGPFGKARQVQVKYIDEQDRECGPFVVEFDPRAQYVHFTKRVMASTTWLTFREYDGRLLVYFTHLVSYKNAFTDIRYSVDDESLSKSVRFGADWSRRSPPVFNEKTDDTYYEIPVGTTMVAVQLTYIDGTQSAVQQFVVAEMDVDGR